MGSVLSYFKKDAPIEKLLDEMDGKIRLIEQRYLNYRARWRKAISNLLLYFCIFEFGYLTIFYLWIVRSSEYEPAEKILWGLPVVLIPFIGWTLKVLINFYYSRRVTGDELELESLKAKQKAKLEEFARATDFYKTREILNRYSKTLHEDKTPTKQAPITPKPTEPGLRHRPPQVGTPIGTPTRPSNPLPTTPQPIQTPQPEPTLPPMRPVPPIYMAVPQDRRDAMTQPPQQRTAPPDPNRPWYDKLIDYMVGDNVEQSVMLVCERCRQNNGLVPRDEMATIQFKCRECGHFNENGKATTQLPSQPTSSPQQEEEESKEEEEAPAEVDPEEKKEN